MSDVISFDEIVSCATVRVTIIDGVQYLSIRDMIMHLCDKNSNNAGGVWRDFSDDKKNEVQDFILNFQFPGRGQSVQPVITFPGALKLAMFLPGENAKRHRSAMVNILQRYYAGDTTLLREIEANAVSMEPVAQMARASLPKPVSQQRVMHLRKRQLEIDQMELDVQLRRMENMEHFQSLMAGLRADTVLDARTRLKLEDMAKNNIMMGSGMLALENGESKALESISVSEVAAGLGYKSLTHGMSVQMGSEAARLYRERYGESPPKHRQWVDGTERLVNSYTARDRDLVEQAVLAVVGQGKDERHNQVKRTRFAPMGA